MVELGPCLTSQKSKEIPFQECNLFLEVASCPCAITLPLAGMCGGGSSGSPGGVTATLLSVFCFVSFLWALGEELEVLLELVTVSPELHETEQVLLTDATNAFYNQIFTFDKLEPEILVIIIPDN